MFLQASVCPQGGGGVCLSAWWDSRPPLPEQSPLEADTPPGMDTPPEQTPPPEQTKYTPRTQYTPGTKYIPSGTKYTPPPQDTATAADGTHYTGMHSCYYCAHFRLEICLEGEFTLSDGRTFILISA